LYLIKFDGKVRLLLLKGKVQLPEWSTACVLITYTIATRTVGSFTIMLISQNVIFKETGLTGVTYDFITDGQGFKATHDTLLLHFEHDRLQVIVQRERKKEAISD
jgi:hypothetical protein